jgi:hypothetical protein
MLKYGYLLKPGHVLWQTFQVSKTRKVFVPPKTDSLKYFCLGS